jgi:hypothetical protein
MVAPLTPKSTRKAEALAKAPPTIAARREEDVALKKWPKPWLFCANDILETKANDGNTTAKLPSTPSSSSGFTSSSILPFAQIFWE